MNCRRRVGKATHSDTTTPCAVEMNRELPAIDIVHVLDGDPGNPKLGGHRAGTGRPGKTEFPAGWSDQDIIAAVEMAMRNPEVVIRGGDRVDYLCEVNAVVIRVSTYAQDGAWFFRTAYPVNGIGVVQNHSTADATSPRPLNRDVIERYR